MYKKYPGAPGWRYDGQFIWIVVPKNEIKDIAIEFIGEPDNNGVYHNAELIGVSEVKG